MLLYAYESPTPRENRLRYRVPLYVSCIQFNERNQFAGPEHTNNWKGRHRLELRITTHLEVRGVDVPTASAKRISEHVAMRTFYIRNKTDVRKNAAGCRSSSDTVRFIWCRRRRNLRTPCARMGHIFLLPLLAAKFIRNCEWTKPIYRASFSARAREQKMSTADRASQIFPQMRAHLPKRRPCLACCIEIRFVNGNHDTRSAFVEIRIRLMIVGKWQFQGCRVRRYRLWFLVDGNLRAFLVLRESRNSCSLFRHRHEVENMVVG